MAPAGGQNFFCLSHVLLLAEPFEMVQYWKLFQTLKSLGFEIRLTISWKISSVNLRVLKNRLKYPLWNSRPARPTGHTQEKFTEVITRIVFQLTRTYWSQVVERPCEFLYKVINEAAGIKIRTTLFWAPIKQSYHSSVKLGFLVPTCWGESTGFGLGKCAKHTTIYTVTLPRGSNLNNKMNTEGSMGGQFRCGAFVQRRNN